MQGSPVVSILSRLPLSAPERRVADRRPVRLTRRGRFVVAVLVATLLAAAIALLLALDPAASAGSSQGRGVASEVVVKPGDTLWSVALRHEPSRDPSATIEEIRRLNHLTGYTVHPGQTLRMP
ncbi:MAG: LysM peptidoglycan-binding domain-containing protein [Micromonosporaceae bacterium]